MFLNHWAHHLGGAEHSLLDLLWYAKDRFVCHLVTSEDGPLIEKAGTLGVRCHVVPCGRAVAHIRRRCSPVGLVQAWLGLVQFVAFVVRLRRTVRSIRPVLVHANVPKSHIALCLLSRLGFRGVSCFHVREIFGRHFFPHLAYGFCFPRRTGRIIAISHAVERTLPHGIRGRATVIHNGIRIPKRARGSHGTHGTRLVYLGRIVPWKGPHLLVDILDMLRHRAGMRDTTLTLVGDTSYWPLVYRDDLVRRIDEGGLGSNCRLEPYTDDVSTVLMSHDVFCSASTDEPFGRSIAEAQACGLPVVSFNSGGVKEIVLHEKTGLLVPPGDTTLFADALERLATSPSLVEQMGREGRKRTQELFDREKQCPKLCELMVGMIRSQCDQQNRNDHSDTCDYGAADQQEYPLA